MRGRIGSPRTAKRLQSKSGDTRAPNFSSAVLASDGGNNSSNSQLLMRRGALLFSMQICHALVQGGFWVNRCRPMTFIQIFRLDKGRVSNDCCLNDVIKREVEYKASYRMRIRLSNYPGRGKCQRRTAIAVTSSTECGYPCFLRPSITLRTRFSVCSWLWLGSHLLKSKFDP